MLLMHLFSQAKAKHKIATTTKEQNQSFRVFVYYEFSGATFFQSQELTVSFFILIITNI